MTRAQFAYFEDRSADEIVRYIKDIIADFTLDEGPDIQFLTLCSNHSASFDTMSREYIYNVLRLMNLLEREQLM